MTQDVFTLGGPNLRALSIHAGNSDKPLMVFHEDGSITVDDAANPSDAAKMVIECLKPHLVEFIRKPVVAARAVVAYYDNDSNAMYFDDVGDEFKALLELLKSSLPLE
jgi:hypothetical protein